ncbi:transcriptional regulator GcvA [Pelagimonas sp. KU-00592-HH]|uniref:LysR substrate-binding domain-containing protein n=1 Tax=Pelagimonas sp. KU-00592-HH TaxID=3127651 RepID=UPI00310542B9
MSKSPNLVWLRSFESAARHMNFTAAAAELGITQTALSLHVRSLEAQLGCPLFTRAARNLTLTEVGQAYAFSVRRALGDIALSTTSLFGASEAQHLTIRIPISSATLWLARRLPDFTQSHPGISIRLASNIWADSAGRENVDVEIRFGRGDWPDVTSHRLTHERIVPIAAAGTPPLSHDDLQTRPAVQILGLQDLWQRYLAAFDIPQDATQSQFAVDTTIAAVDIVAAGGGYAVILERFAETAIAIGRDIAIVGQPLPIEQAHYVTRPSATSTNNTAAQLFTSWLEQIAK